MQHAKKGRTFHRITGRRRSFLRGLASDLIKIGKITTTETRAKAIRPFVERCVTIAKKQDLAARRLLLARLESKQVVDRLMSGLAPRYAERRGGYLRIVKLGKVRKRDAAPTASIEFI